MRSSIRDLFFTHFTVLDCVSLKMDIAKSETFKNFTILNMTLLFLTKSDKVIQE